MFSPRLLLCVPLATGLGGCTFDDLFASDFKKFQSCVEAVSKDGIVTKPSARNICAQKYAEEADTTQVSGTASFSWCWGDDACDVFTVNIANKSRDRVILSARIIVAVGGATYVGQTESPLWIEPGGTASAPVTINKKLSKAEREGFTWVYTGVKALKIDA